MTGPNRRQLVSWTPKQTACAGLNATNAPKRAKIRERVPQRQLHTKVGEISIKVRKLGMLPFAGHHRTVPAERTLGGETRVIDSPDARPARYISTSVPNTVSAGTHSRISETCFPR